MGLRMTNDVDPSAIVWLIVFVPTSIAFAVVLSAEPAKPQRKR
jgi:hypothetical protein